MTTPIELAYQDGYEHGRESNEAVIAAALKTIRASLDLLEKVAHEATMSTEGQDDGQGSD